MNLCDLPTLVLSMVVRYLDVPSLINSSKTNRILHQIIKDNRHKLARPRVSAMLYEEHRSYSKKLQLNVSNESGLRFWYYTYLLSDQQKVEDDDGETARNFFRKRFHFTSVEQVETGVAEALAHFLEKADLEEFIIGYMDDTVVERISSVFRANQRCRVHSLHLDELLPYHPERAQSIPMTSSSLCRFIRSIHGVQKYHLKVPIDVITGELFKIPQICEATEQLVIKHPFKYGQHPSPSLTDSELLALSAKRIQLEVFCGTTANFPRTFVQEFLSKKREIDNPTGKETFNYIQVKLPNWHPEEIFRGMGLHRDSSRSGYFMRDDGDALEFEWTLNTFRYRLVKNGTNLWQLLHSLR